MADDIRVAPSPKCPEDCPMCSGETCNKCGAGCWSSVRNCQHDVIERHDAVAPSSEPSIPADLQRYYGGPDSDDFTDRYIERIGRAEDRIAELERVLRKLERLIVELYPGHVEPDDEHLEEYKAVWNAVMTARAALEGK